MSHTPTPWAINAMASGHIVSDGRSIGSVGGLNDGTEKTHLENEANAAFIVKACNNHEKLLKALEKIVRKTEDMIPPFRAMGADQMMRIAKEAIKAAQE